MHAQPYIKEKESSISQAVPGAKQYGDKLFRLGLRFAVGVVLLIICSMIALLFYRALPTLDTFGFGFLTGRAWDAAQASFGALPFIYGTVVSSCVALLLAMPLALGVAIFLTELASTRLARPLALLVELLAAIPSVVYGLWGIFVLAPFVQNYLGRFLGATLGWTPLFSGVPTGMGMLTAGILLALMITPIITIIMCDVLAAVPRAQREAALALGATRWEATRVVLANSAAGIAVAILLGLGRAVGETMAITMVIGNKPQISTSLFEPAATLASALSSNFGAAADRLYLSALVEISLILLLITFVINACAKLLVWQMARRA